MQKRRNLVVTIDNAQKMPVDSAIQPALLKLIEILEEESAALQQPRVVSHANFTDRKNQALRDLMAARRVDEPVSAPTSCKPLLARLSTALRANATLLKLHIAAVGEISDLIISGLREAESDGTYSRGAHPVRR
jgi:hypothetical protein